MLQGQAGCCLNFLPFLLYEINAGGKKNKPKTKMFLYYDLNLQKLYLQSQLLIPQHSMGIQQTPGKCHVIYTSSELTQSLKVKKTLITMMGKA